MATRLLQQDSLVDDVGEQTERLALPGLIQAMDTADTFLNNPKKIAGLTSLAGNIFLLHAGIKEGSEAKIAASLLTMIVGAVLTRYGRGGEASIARETLIDLLKEQMTGLMECDEETQKRIIQRIIDDMPPDPRSPMKKLLQEKSTALFA